MTCAPSEDSDQPGHLPSLIRVSAIHIKKPCVLGDVLSVLRKFDQTGRKPILISDFVWHTGHFAGYVMRRLNCLPPPDLQFLERVGKRERLHWKGDILKTNLS